MEFPIVDLDRVAEDENEIAELKRGLTDVGFFYVKNWGCSDEFIKKVQKMTREIFHATKEEQNRLQAGFTKFGTVGLGTLMF